MEKGLKSGLKKKKGKGFGVKGNLGLGERGSSRFNKVGRLEGSKGNQGEEERSIVEDTQLGLAGEEHRGLG